MVFSYVCIVAFVSVLFLPSNTRAQWSSRQWSNLGNTDTADVAYHTTVVNLAGTKIFTFGGAHGNRLFQGACGVKPIRKAINIPLYANQLISKHISALSTIDGNDVVVLYDFRADTEYQLSYFRTSELRWTRAGETSSNPVPQKRTGQSGAVYKNLWYVFGGKMVGTSTTTMMNDLWKMDSLTKIMGNAWTCFV